MATWFIQLALWPASSWHTADGQLLLEHLGDGPLLLTLTCAAEALMRGGVGFDPVWVSPGK